MTLTYQLYLDILKMYLDVPTYRKQSF